MDITTFIVDFLLVAVGALLMFVGTKIYQWYHSLSSDYQFMLESFVEMACEVAERVYAGDARGKEKLQAALELVESMCEQKGITFDVQTVTDMIDEYVLKVINKGKKK